MVGSLLCHLSKDALVYATGPVLLKSIGLMLVPIYTAYLTPSDYGDLAFVWAIAALVMPVIDAGTGTAFWRFGAGDHTLPKYIVIFNILCIHSVIAILVILSIACLYMLTHDRYRILPYVLLYSPMFLMGSLVRMIQFEFQSSHRPRIYVAFAVANALCVALANILLLGHYGLGVTGILLGNGLGTLLACVVFSPFYLLRFLGRIDIALIRRMLVYGIPLVPGNLSGTMLRMSDRFMLIHLSTPRDLGLYSYGYSFASLLNTVVILPFFLSFNPMRWEIHARGDARRIFSILHKAIVIGLVCMYMIFVPLVTLLGTFMSRDREFLQGLSVVPIIAFSYLLFGVYYFTQMGLLFEGRTLLISVLLLTSSAIGLGLNLLLIPAFGFMGAAFSSVISHLTLLYSGSVLSQRYYPIPIDRRMQLMALALAGGFCTMTCLCGMHTHLLQISGGALVTLLLFLGLMVLRYRHIPPWIFDTPRQICSIFRRASQV